MRVAVETRCTQHWTLGLIFSYTGVCADINTYKWFVVVVPLPGAYPVLLGRMTFGYGNTMSPFPRSAVCHRVVLGVLPFRHGPSGVQVHHHRLRGA